MPHRALSSPYLRYLKVLDSADPSPQPLADLIGPQVLLDDFSDISSPHQGPMFCANVSIAAGAAEFGLILLGPTIRPVRLWMVQGVLGEQARMAVFPTNLITAGAGVWVPAGLGPVSGNVDGGDRPDWSSPTFLTGRSAATLTTSGMLLGTQNSTLLDQQAQMPARPFLVPGGEFFTIYNTVVNDLLSVNLIFEEIPRYGELVNVGFPIPS